MRRCFYDKAAYQLIITTIENCKNKSKKSNEEYYYLRTLGIIDVLTEKLLIEKLCHIFFQRLKGEGLKKISSRTKNKHIHYRNYYRYQKLSSKNKNLVLHVAR